MMFRSRTADPIAVPTMSTGGRTLSVLAGLALAAAAVRPRPNRFLSVLALATGSYLAYRGATGRCPITEAFEEHFGEIEPPRRR
ncbi:DUF2892 domain-containing protein [Kaistia geumhonensis]|uniref:Membrane protein n=1 Tax=Kaistia geumhonensis TaxID=410839 RepID=A0ABU0MBJ2_9HYPH|nr:YgaP-like transmembrane domain [Kaistia geumhonensis]MCX5481274.1 DUF2892 domain-containing protein [Kaistia geumhonensis]MDQ0518335.1 putative membrane protein [Kaistia geumhonensis]